MSARAMSSGRSPLPPRRWASTPRAAGCAGPARRSLTVRAPSTCCRSHCRSIHRGAFAPTGGGGAPGESAATQPDSYLHVPELERIARRLAALQRPSGVRLERLSNPEAEVVVERAPVAEHDPLPRIDAPLPGRLDHLHGAAVANRRGTKPSPAHRFEYRPAGSPTCVGLVPI